jgi:hypothetical protein
MYKHFGRVARVAHWLSQPGHVESLLALFITLVVAYIFIRCKLMS